MSNIRNNILYLERNIQRHLELRPELCSSNWTAKVLAAEPVCQRETTSGWYSWQEVVPFSLLV